MYVRRSYSGNGKWMAGNSRNIRGRNRRKRGRSLKDILFAVSTTAALILSILAVLIALRPEIPGFDLIFGSGMVAEGAAGRAWVGMAGFPLKIILRNATIRL